MSSTPVEVTRTDRSVFAATNGRGGEVTISTEEAPDSFTPGELLLAAVAGCAQLTGENLLTRRVGEDCPITVHADRELDEEEPNRFGAVRLSFEVDLSAVEDETERAKLAAAVERAIARRCTVSRSVEHGTPVTVTPPR
ncbi:MULTISPECIES: OsmC family protein [Actinopolyspora]|uniref:Uncharacterized OsmC-related protein n=1 Tax=Actinopolyspora saharensis TaxID=995062 RepID=A0A1H0Y7H3_9ACTN|nr:MULTISPECIES: OsmC family protein [Actinopolyspora]NHD17575.1 OsmC family protein [Actinopolyspora sp. BKK2]NHE76692.1 OsmC family protein [Actinopolyspora sp. BKK1]SDQ11033.1 Uncharacterized OsmC-related protein [Actinopolyspora saharensis]